MMMIATFLTTLQDTDFISLRHGEHVWNYPSDSAGHTLQTAGYQVSVMQNIT